LGKLHLCFAAVSRVSFVEGERAAADFAPLVLSVVAEHGLLRPSLQQNNLVGACMRTPLGHTCTADTTAVDARSRLAVQQG
jgi:hypothetical protein